jgi:subtilisin family serine protease
LGPSFDNRIKPDVAAMGLSTITALPDGTISGFNGTSFSAPMLAGLAAGMVQAFPNKKAWEIIDIIRRSGNQSTKPDNFLGYGIPNFDRASKIINPVLALEPSATDRITVYPNPVSFGQAIRIESPFNSNLQLEIISTQGAVLQTLTNLTSQSEIFLPPFISGKYYFRFTSATGTQTIPVALNL